MGTSQANAIAVPLTLDADELVAKLQPTVASRTPRWFAVTLPANERRTLSVSASYKGAPRSVDVDLLDPAGRVLAHATVGSDNAYDHYGYRSASLTDVGGAYFIRVTTHEGALNYVLDVSSAVIAPRPKEWDPCNAYLYDPENPRCKGIVACDPNKPDTKNPACCSKRCMRGECSANITRGGAEENYAYINLGANAGITTWYDGFAVLNLVGGVEKQVPIKVVEVEPTRSKVLVGSYSSLDLDRFDGRLARLKTPPQCATDE
jgi:hypothetical protein